MTQDHKQNIILTEAQLEAIVEEAANRAVAKMTGKLYEGVGRGVVAKGLWLLGVIAVALYAYFQGRGSLPGGLNEIRP